MATNTYVALKQTTVSSATTSVTISGIPATYTDLVAVIQSTTSSPAPSTSLQFNGDTTSNYSHTYLTGDGSSASSSRNSTDRALIAYNGTVGSNPNTVIVNIMNYANTTTYKTFLSRASNATYGTDAVVGMWRKTPEAINSITFLTGTTGFAVGSTFSLYGIAATSVGAKATGGIISSDDQYYYHTFASTGTFTPLQSLTADYLVVAGGGGGGGLGGGGGAGGLRCTVTATGGGGSLETPLSLSATGYTVTVGAGGNGAIVTSSGEVTAATNGSNSVFSTITSTGGGAGSGGINANGLSGGSGGGARGGTGTSYTGGSGTTNQGYAGGNNATTGNTPCGGGGGAGQVGANATSTTGGKGGDGVTTLISGTSVTYAGGGGGATFQGGTAGAGGTGGGGAAAPAGANNSATAGTANTGGGGGGTGYQTNYTNAANGGSGIVIVRYAK
jgi:hypothetical protein